MLVVDSNMLICAVNSATQGHAVCRDRIESWRRGAEAWGTTWSVLCEFLRVATHARVLSKPLTVRQAWTFVEALLESPSFRVLEHTDRHAELAATTLTEFPDLSGNILHDVHTAVVMREHGVRRVLTRDTGFHRIPFVEAIDPLR